MSASTFLVLKFFSLNICALGTCCMPNSNKDIVDPRVDQYQSPTLNEFTFD